MILFISCKNEKETLIRDYETLIEKASNVYLSCDEKTWQQLVDEFRKLENRYSQVEKKISAQEKERIETLRGRYYSIKMKYDANRIKQKLKRSFDNAKGFVDELFN